MSAALREKLAALPSEPGVYLYRDARERVLYVGKAKSLRKRVRSYFRGAPRGGDGGEGPLRARNGLHPRIADLVERIADVEVIVTDTEHEAMLLEANLVRRHKPPFNVRLRDDKSYPYIAVSLDEDFPRVYFTRERHRSDRRYFGPFSSAHKVRDTLKLVGKIFPSRPCEGQDPGRPSGIPCLDYHIRRCLAPCVGYIDREEYGQLIDQIIAFLSGRYRGLEDELEEDMRTASAEQDFEAAATHRNRLAAVRHLMERQRTQGGGAGAVDVLGVALDDEVACVQVLQVRDGVLQDRQTFYLDAEAADGDAVVVDQFAREYYAMGGAIPPQIIVPRNSPISDDLVAVLAGRRGARVEVRPAERGDKRALSELARRNATLALDGDRLTREGVRATRREGAAELRETLGLAAPPTRIECFDISNLGPTYAVASMVVLEGGAPAKAHYRSFTMRDAEGVDDVSRMEEAIARRLRRLSDQDGDPSFSARPSLMVIDGGPTQLGAAERGVAAAGAGDLPLVALAKRREELFVPGRREPLLLDRASPGLRLLIQVRDEAHRFALRHHRNRRGHGMTMSLFDSIPGVGPLRKRALLRHFGSPERVLAATPDELAAVPGLPAKVAGTIHGHLHRTAAAEGV